MTNQSGKRHFHQIITHPSAPCLDRGDVQCGQLKSTFKVPLSLPFNLTLHVTWWSRFGSLVLCIQLCRETATTWSLGFRSANYNCHWVDVDGLVWSWRRPTDTVQRSLPMISLQYGLEIGWSWFLLFGNVVASSFVWEDHHKKDL